MVKDKCYGALMLNVFPGPFPHVNDTKQVQDISLKLRRIAYTVVHGGGATFNAIVAGIYYWISVAT